MTYKTVYISTNGILAFAGCYTVSNNVPSYQQPLDTIAPFWDNLVVTSQSIYTYVYESCFIIQWTNMEFYPTPNYIIITFQAWLCENNVIFFKYNSLLGPTRAFGASATIGLPLEPISYNIAILHEGAIYVFPSTLAPAPVVPDVVLAGDETPRIEQLSLIPYNMSIVNPNTLFEFSWTLQENSPLADYNKLFVGMDYSMLNPVIKQITLTEPRFKFTTNIFGTYFWKVFSC